MSIPDPEPARRRVRLLLPVVSVLAGAGAAALVIALGAGSSHAKPVPLSRYVSRITLANNRVELSPTEADRLLKWSRRVRTCMSKAGVRVGPPTVADSEILIALPRPKAKGSRLQIVKEGGRCAADAGGPPAHTAFVFERDGKIHLYRPRACLLPVVAAKT